MNNEIEKLEAERKEVYSKTRIKMPLGMILIIVGLVLSLTNTISILGYILLVIGIILIIIAQGHIKKFSKKYKENVVRALVKDTFGDAAIYNPDGMVDISSVLHPGFFRKPDRYHGEDYIKSSYDDVLFEMSDVTLEERIETTDSKGHRIVTYRPYFNGRFFIFDFNKDMNKTLYILPGKQKRNNLVKFETESIAFNKKYSALAEFQEDGFYILTPKMIDRILALSELYRGQQFYAFLGGKLYVAINNVNSLEVNVRMPLNNETLKKTRGDLNIAPAIINEFGLNKSKFTNEKEIEPETSKAKDDIDEILDEIDEKVD